MSGIDQGTHIWYNDLRLTLKLEGWSKLEVIMTLNGLITW